MDKGKEIENERKKMKDGDEEWTQNLRQKGRKEDEDTIYKTRKLNKLLLSICLEHIEVIYIYIYIYMILELNRALIWSLNVFKVCL